MSARAGRVLGAVAGGAAAATALGEFSDSEASGLRLAPMRLAEPEVVVDDLSMAQLTDMLMAAPCSNEMRAQILRAGMDLAQDHRVQQAVMERVRGDRKKLPAAPAPSHPQPDAHALHEEVEDARELNMQLLLENDKLQSKVDALESRLRALGEYENLNRLDGDDEGEGEGEEEEEARQGVHGERASSGRSRVGANAANNGPPSPPLSGLWWPVVLGIASLILMLVLRR